VFSHLDSFIVRPCTISAVEKAEQPFYAGRPRQPETHFIRNWFLKWLYAVSFIFRAHAQAAGAFHKKFYGYRRLPTFASLSMAGSGQRPFDHTLKID
jgi:hypothetical protein